MMALEWNFNYFTDHSVIQIPKFSACKRGNFRRVTFTHKGHVKKCIFNVFVFPYGHFLDNEDYVAVMITFRSSEETPEVFGHKEYNDPDYITKSNDLKFLIGLDYDSLCWTLSIVDVEGHHCFCQSFMKQDFLCGDQEFGLIRFLRRSLLLDRKEEFLPDDTVTLRCDVRYRFQDSCYGSSESGKMFNLIFDNSMSEISFFTVGSDPSSFVEQRLHESTKLENLKKQFTQFADFTQVQQMSRKVHNWKEEDFDKELKKRSLEIVAFLKSFWKSELFRFDNRCDLKHLINKFIDIRCWIEDVSYCFGGNELLMPDLCFELQYCYTGEESVSDLLDCVDEKILYNSFPQMIHNTFKWNTSYYQQFMIDQSKDKWEVNLEILRFKTIAFLKSSLYDMFRFLLDLKIIFDKESNFVKNIESPPLYDSNSTEFLALRFDQFFDVETKEGKVIKIPYNKNGESLGTKLLNMSPFFDKMLSNDTYEARQRFVFLKNIRYDCFDNFIHFVKFNSLRTNTFDDIVDLYQLADYFAVLDLQEVCANALVLHMNEETIQDIQALANLHSDKNLQKLADDFLSKHHYLRQFIYQ